MVENLITLGFLVLLQAVLGFDNLLYISLESRRAPEDKRALTRNVGIGLAIALRLVLLVVLVSLIEAVKAPFFSIDTAWLSGEFNFHSVIVLLGGGFIMYTALKEIWHMTSLEEHDETSTKTMGEAIGMIAAMNVVFSFDSILSAIALTKVMWVMAAAIIIGGILMIWAADWVSEFLERNRTYEVLGLFILFLVGVLLLSEGGHLAHLHLFGYAIEAMSKATFYFVIAILFITDIVQSRYKKKLTEKKREKKQKSSG
ncbi:MAG: TerC family protein [Bradymonadaceae bacterium]